MTRVLILKEKASPRDQSLLTELRAQGIEPVLLSDQFNDLDKVVNDLSPDSIIADFNTETGIPFLDTVRSLKSTLSIPFIFLVYPGNKETLSPFYSCKPAGILTKPFKTVDLIAMIEMICPKPIATSWFGKWLAA